jgi:sugar phosphate isomerase/epimerase
MGTRTGHFPIGFRQGGGAWQKDLAALGAWSKAQGFDLIDLGKSTPEDLAALKKAGLTVGTVDLQNARALLSPDAAKRKDAVAQNLAYIKASAENGAKLFFTVAMPEDVEKTRADNHKLAVESFGQLGAAAKAVGGRVLFEGWPGGDRLPNLYCNPETLRAIFKETACPALGINYDPSHLIRMGIDHVRFVEEFAERIGHVHAKDTEIFEENVYDYGLFQHGAFGKAHGYGGFTWRYTIPGHGCARWTRIFQALTKAGYAGAVSVELEDENFNGTEDGEKAALKVSLEFLRST